MLEDIVCCNKIFPLGTGLIVKVEAKILAGDDPEASTVHHGVSLFI
jgi:hypothetical protein